MVWSRNSLSLPRQRQSWLCQHHLLSTPSSENWNELLLYINLPYMFRCRFILYFAVCWPICLLWFKYHAVFIILNLQIVSLIIDGADPPLIFLFKVFLASFELWSMWTWKLFVRFLSTFLYVFSKHDTTQQKTF